MSLVLLLTVTYFHFSTKSTSVFDVFLPLAGFPIILPSNVYSSKDHHAYEQLFLAHDAIHYTSTFIYSLQSANSLFKASSSQLVTMSKSLLHIWLCSLLFGSNLGFSRILLYGTYWRDRPVATAGQPGRIVCHISSARFNQFPIGQISRNFNTTRRSVLWWKLSEQNLEKFYSKGWFFQKKATISIQRDNVRKNARCMQARKTTHSLDGQH